MERRLPPIHPYEDAVLAALAAAPEDDEGELSEETAAALAEGRRDIAEGRVFSHDEVMLQLRGSHAKAQREWNADSR